MGNLNKNQTYHLDNADEPLSLPDNNFGLDALMAEMTYMTTESEKGDGDNLTFGKTALI